MITLAEVLNELGLSQKAVEQAIRPGGPRWLMHAANGRRLLPPATLDELLDWSELNEDQRLRLRHADIRARIARGHHRPPVERHPGLAAAAVAPMNYDHIVPLSRTCHALKGPVLFTKQPERVATGPRQFAREVAGVAELYGPDAICHAHGGATFNTFRILATSDLGFRLGLVGVSGSAPRGSRLKSHGEVCRTPLGIAVSFVRQLDSSAGRCLSVVCAEGDQVQRKMLTWPGANEELYGHLVNNFWEIVDYLASARVVVASSLLDRRSPDVLADILEQVVLAAPDITICFDPGDAWASERRDAVRRILDVSTLLFATEEELVKLAVNYADAKNPEAPPPSEFTADEPDHARTVLGLMRADRPQGPSTVIVVKHRGATSQYRRNGAPLHTDLPELAPTVEDDTGAGDAFAAGYLAVLLSGSTDWRLAAELGMLLARAKLAVIGPPSAADIRREVHAALASI